MRFARVPAGIANESIAPNTPASRPATMPAAMFSTPSWRMPANRASGNATSKTTTAVKTPHGRTIIVFMMARPRRPDGLDARITPRRPARFGGGVPAERRAVPDAVLRDGGAGPRRPGDVSERARGRRLDARPVSPVTAELLDVGEQFGQRVAPSARSVSRPPARRSMSARRCR